MSSCPICFNPVTSPSCCVPCGHVYCTPCIERWTTGSHVLSAESKSCPQCRVTVRSIQIVRIDTGDSSEEVTGLQRQLQERTEEKENLLEELKISAEKCDRLLNELQESLVNQAEYHKREKEKTEELNVAKSDLYKLQEETQYWKQQFVLLTEEKEILRQDQIRISDKYELKCTELVKLYQENEEMKLQTFLQANAEDYLKKKLQAVKEDREKIERGWKHKEMQWERWKKQIKEEYQNTKGKLKMVAQSELLQAAVARQQKEQSQIPDEYQKNLEKLNSRLRLLEKENAKLKEVNFNYEREQKRRTENKEYRHSYFRLYNKQLFVAILVTLAGILCFAIWR